jgi:DNA primase
MMRGVDLILEGGLDVRIVQLPEDDDPDSFVQKNGGAAFEELLKKSVSFIEYKASEFLRSGKFESPEGKAEAIRSLVQSIGKIPDQLKRTFFIKDVAQKYDLYESTLYGELEKSTRKVPQKFVQSTPAEVPEEERTIAERTVTVEEIPIEEKELLSAILEDAREMIPFVFANMQPSDLSHPMAVKIATAALVLFDETGDVEVNQLLEMLHDENEKMMVANVTFNKYQLGERWSKIGSRTSETRLYEIALGAIKSIKKKQLEKELAENRIGMKNASVNGSDTIPFLKRQQEILSALKEIDGLKLMKG